MGWLALFFLLLNHSSAYAADGIPEPLQGIHIRDSYFKSPFKEVARVQRILGEGRIVILRRASKEAFYAHKDDPVHENDAVYSMGNARCRLAFNDQNVLTMAPHSDLLIDEVDQDLSKSEKRSLFEVTRGKIVFYAIKLFSTREMRMTVKTPTATVGIRGTKFGTQVEELPRWSDSFKNRLVASSEPVFLAAGEGDNSLTRVYVSEGRVGVTSDIDGKSQEVGTNELVESGPEGMGTVSYDPARVNAFMNEVEGPFLGLRQAPPSPKPAGLPGDASQQQQEDLMKQMDQIEDAKHIETQKDIEHPHEEHSSPPSPPSGPGCEVPCP